MQEQTYTDLVKDLSRKAKAILEEKYGNDHEGFMLKAVADVLEDCKYDTFAVLFYSPNRSEALESMVDKTRRATTEIDIDAATKEWAYWCLFEDASDCVFEDTACHGS